MQTLLWSKRAALAAALLTVTSAASVHAADAVSPDLQAQIQELQTKVNQLQAQQNENWLTEERANQIKSLVQEVIADSKTRGTFADGVDVGYKDGFYIQTADKNFKLVIGGFIQFRYEYAQHNATNGRTLPSRTVATGQTTTPSDPENSSGFDIRRARINFSGNAFSPDITFKFEGDFYGGSNGSFTVTDAYLGYRYSDLIKIKAGSFKVPFAKAELTSDTSLSLMERPESLLPFDPVRALGISLYGDIIKDKLTYDINANDGSKTNTLKTSDAYGITPNLDNRLAFYGRLQYAGAGSVKDFSDEADLRKDNREFIWMLGAAAGYESQNATNNGTASPQTTAVVPGLSTNNSAGFLNPYNLNGDLFRGTVDWSAKYQGWQLNLAAYFQQVNANPGNTSTSSASTITTGPYGPSKSSFFQQGYYGQVGYMVIPQKLELIARAGVLLTEGDPNIGEFYTLGAAYYIYGQNVKIQSDVTYISEDPYTDAASSQLINTQSLIYRIQLQLKF